ncbi:MAG: hypothetical protein ACKOC5_00005, partial [Chloroflexota bacterium]
GVYAVSALWSAAYLRPNQPGELWSMPPAPGQARLFSATVSELSNRFSGMPEQIDIVSTFDTPALRWALRDYPQARFSAGLDLDRRPSLVITRGESDLPALSDAYRGQDFAWWVQPAWSGLLPPSPIAWWTYRRAPTTNDTIILWARGDLFAGPQPAREITP